MCQVPKVKKVEVHQCAKFRRNCLNCGRGVIFRFLKMAASDFINLKFLKFGTVKRVGLHNHAKFCRNRSNRGRDMAILLFFKMADAVMLDF